MDVFTMVVLIVLIGCLSGIFSSYFKSKRRVDPKIKERLERLEALVGDDSLEERVRALETIATDKKRNLADEIRSL